MRRQRGGGTKFVPRDGVERVVTSCSMSRATFIRKMLVSALLDITNVVASLTSRGTSPVHFYGQLPYNSFCRLVDLVTPLSIIAILLYRALTRALPTFLPSASTATTAPMNPPTPPPTLALNLTQTANGESPRTQSAKSKAEGQRTKPRGFGPNVAGQGPIAEGLMPEAKRQPLTETG